MILTKTCRMRILVDARDFVSGLERDIAAATDSIDVQTMSLAGDAAGWALVRALTGAAHVRRRRVMVAGTGQRDRAATPAMLAELRAAGVQVRFSNPAGMPARRQRARNHKKSVIIDGRISYFGGLDFADHIFEWHDMMMRCDDAQVAAGLARDFQAAWRGRHEAMTASAPGIEIMTTDGRANSLAFDRVFSRVAGARASIIVHSPYLSLPFFEHLRRAALRGVRVVVITASENTVESVGRCMTVEALRSCFELHLTPGMSHLKALLIDDSALVTGSSSFDYLSCRLHQEVIAIVTEPAVIAQFRACVLEPDLRACSTPRQAASTFAGPLVRA